MLKRTIILLLLSVLSAAGAVPAANPVHHHAVPHSPTVQPDSATIVPSDRNIRLYDSLRVKASRRRVSKILYDLLIRDPAVVSADDERAVDEVAELSIYDGRQIGDITFQRDELFNRRHTWVARAGSKLHAPTSERAIRRDLLLRSGGTFDAATLVRNKQLLQSRPYISEAAIEVRPDSCDSATVHLVVRTRDRWTIGVDGAMHSRGRTMIGLYDANFLGTGNRLSVNTNFNRKNFAYGGNAVRYEIPNLLGSFFQADLAAGRSFTESELRFGLSREFIAPTDYEAGASYENVKSDIRMTMLDTIVTAGLRRWNLWGGRSVYLPGIRSSIYMTAHYGHGAYRLRPDVGAHSNPRFHDYDFVLAGAGLYRENLFKTHYVDGMGVSEYFATGYRAELTGGYRWGEFGNDIYIGVGLHGGGFLPHGYLAGGASVGSFIDPHSGAWAQSVVAADIGWFSNLHRARRNSIRYYVSANYTAGWNRFSGYGEVIGFKRTANVRNINRHGLNGTNRLTINTQAVIFTPLQPLGFRIAVVAFTDVGLLGYSHNIFKNSFYNSLGIGLRIRNERMVFSIINLRVGFAWGRDGILPSRWFETSSDSPIVRSRYLPSRPEFIGFE